jgi:MFS family permease
LGIFVKRLGYKSVLALGCAAYVARFAVFASSTSAIAIVSAQALHGVCYGCFFAAAYLYVEHVAPADIRHSAQTVFGIIILGLGPVLAGFYNRYFDRFTEPGIVNGAAAQVQSYKQFWWAQAGIAAAAMLLLGVFFPGRDRGTGEADIPQPAAMPDA